MHHTTTPLNIEDTLCSGVRSSTVSSAGNVMTVVMMTRQALSNCMLHQGLPTFDGLINPHVLKAKVKLL